MELSNILLLLLSFVPFMYLCLHRLKLRNGPKNVNDAGSFRLPPGSTGFPLIGETLKYYSKIRVGCQYEFVKERMDKFSSKIFRTSLIGQPVAILCNAEGNKFLFSNENKLVRVWLPSRVDRFFPHSNNSRQTGEHSKWLRDMVFPWIFRADVLRERLGVMDALMKQHLETYWASKDVVKVAEMAKRYTLTLACNFFLGVNDTSKIDELVQGMDAIEAAFFGMPVNFPGTAFNRGIKASKIMRSKIEAIIRQRKMDLSTKHSSSSVKDLMSHMLLEVDENGEFFKEEDIASYLVALMLVGHTTLHATITMVMTCLADHSGVYDAVHKEQIEIARKQESRDRLCWEDIRKMKYSWSVVCEVLRLYTPGIGSFREAITDFTYERYTIPKGWKMHWMSQATHMSPKYFDDPEKFDPSRFEGDQGPIPYTFVPFGAGSRMCPGHEYARLAALTFVHHAVSMFSWEKVVPGETLVKYPHPRPAQGLPLRLYPHKA